MGKSFLERFENDAASVVDGKQWLGLNLSLLVELVLTVNFSTLLAPELPEVYLNHLPGTAVSSMRLCSAMVKKTMG